MWCFITFPCISDFQVNQAKMPFIYYMMIQKQQELQRFSLVLLILLLFGSLWTNNLPKWFSWFDIIITKTTLSLKLKRIAKYKLFIVSILLLYYYVKKYHLNGILLIGFRMILHNFWELTWNEMVERSIIITTKKNSYFIA